MSRVRYVLSMPEPATHLLHVRVEVDGAPGPHTDFVLPAWTPGSYRIRDFARHVQEFSAGGRTWTKTDKSRWRVEGGGSVAVEYKVFAFELSVRSSHLDSDHAFVNGAGVFMLADGMKDDPVELSIRAPRGWRTATALRSRRGRFLASGYDELADSPIEIGSFERRTFRVGGRRHELAIHGPGNHDPARLVADLKKIVEAERRIFRELPYERYVFILHHVPEGGGGLEHRASTALQYPPYQYRPREKYENFLELAAHEFFHLWNVKRIRPEMLGPFDYEREVYTRLLWVMEGITSYYDTLVVTRAKLASADRYLKKTSERIRKFEEKPGRRKQALSASSFDAWIGLYQPNENAPNCQMSYYEKGELVGMCLDLELRQRTAGRKSLDDVMRLLWTEWGRRDRGFPEDEFRRTCERVAGGSLAAFWRDFVDGTAEIPWGRFLAHVGIELHREPEKPAEGEPPRDAKPWLGASLQKSAGGMAVSAVVEGGPAWKAGLSVKDEIVALDGLKAGEDLERRLDEASPGDRVRLALFRSGVLRELEVVLGRRDAGTRALRRVKSPTALQKRIYEGWLGHPWAPDRR